LGLLLASCNPKPSAQGVELTLHLPGEIGGVPAKDLEARVQAGSQPARSYPLAQPGACRTSGSATSCELQLALPPGSYLLRAVLARSSAEATPLAYATTPVTVLPGKSERLSLTSGGVLTGASIAPVSGALILTHRNSRGAVTGYDLAGAESIPETFTLTLHGAAGSVLLEPASGASQPVLCAGNPQELRVRAAGLGQYRLRALRPFGASPQSLYLARGSCSGAALGRRGGEAPPAALPEITETQAVLVSNQNSNAVTAYTAQGDSLAFRIQGLSSPFGLAFDPQNGWLYVVSSSTNRSGRVTAYQTPTGKPALRGELHFSIRAGLASPIGLALDPENGLLYVANELGGTTGTVTAYRAQTGVELGHPFIGSGLAGPMGLTVDPKRAQLYVTNYYPSNTLTAYRARSGTRESIGGKRAIRSGLFFPEGSAFDPHNGLLYVANYLGGAGRKGSVTAYRARSGTRESIGGKRAIRSGLFFPEDLAYDSQNGLLYVANLGGGAGRKGSVTAYRARSGNAENLTGSATRGGAITAHLDAPAFLTVVP
jgi:DNA-binding beta-propeller fold protein YncE